LALDGDAGVVAHFGAQTGEGVEQGRLAAVGIAGQCDVCGALRDRAGDALNFTGHTSEKLQFPSPKLQRSSNSQNPYTGIPRIARDLGAWGLALLWSLELGTGSFSSRLNCAAEQKSNRLRACAGSGGSHAL